MSLPNELLPVGLLATPAAGGAYEIERSLRFNSADSAYLSRTPASAGNRKTWTWAGWVKRSKISDSVDTQFFSAGTSGASNLDAIGFTTSDTINFYSYNGSFVYLYNTTAVFRDPSAWYHIVAVLDTTNATSTDRVKLYVNGVRVTTFASSTAPSQNADGAHVNTTNTHYIGKFIDLSQYFNGYLADVHFIDGQALDPTSFGEFDTNGVWQPIAYSGIYGTNGFHLPFSDNSSAFALGNDTSGNNNDWTVNNIAAVAASTGFKTVTYTGNSSTQTISGFGFSPDLVWIKSRSAGYSHRIYDTIRGTADALYSDLTVAEGDSQSINENLTAFTSDGFSLGTTSGINAINNSGVTFVAWGWDAGSSTVSNTDGTITSSVRANQATGFSIVTYTGNISANQTIGHGLGAAPQFIIVKRRSSVEPWYCYHKFIDATAPADYDISLNSTAARRDYPTFGDTLPTSTVFSVGQTGASNETNETYVAYCFAPKPGVSAIGSYTGNGSTSGPSVTTGFQPSFILMKRTDAAGYNWVIFDAARNNFNERIYPNDSAAGATGITAYSVNSTGFTVVTNDTVWNASGGTYIYMAFAGTESGKDIDSLVDSVTNGDTANDTGLGGQVPGNYATLNALKKGSAATLSNGNLDVSCSTATSRHMSTIAVSSGKWYAEFTYTGTNISIGIAKATCSIDTGSGTTQYWGGSDDTWAYYSNGSKYTNNSGSSYGTSISNGDVIGIAFDADNGDLYFYKNGTVQNSGTAAFTGLTSGPYVFGAGESGLSGSWNFGQRAFAYTAPSGFKALCTANLPEPTIADGSTAMDVKLYTGNGSTQTISGLGFSPDFVWIKNRTDSAAHRLLDTVRGATKVLYSDFTDAETTESTSLTAFNSDGFTVGSENGVNGLNDAIVAWTWDAGSSTVSNTDGSITSSVRANASAGFSVVTYTGNGSSATVGHGLGVTPAFIIVKCRNAGFATNWVVWSNQFASLTNNFLRLDTAGSTDAITNYWGSAAPTSTVFGVAGGGYDNNHNTLNHVAYCFAPVAGYSSMGSYVGNGSSNGVFVYTGHQIKFLLIKNTTLGGSNWRIIDTARNPYNVANLLLNPNSSNAEQTTTLNTIDLLSNGFKCRGTDGDTNSSGDTFIYCAFASHPFQTARAR